MKSIDLDIETRSYANIEDVSVNRYAEDEGFQLLLLGYSIDDGPVHVVDLASGDKIPEEVLEALRDPHVRKYAHHAAFERICLSTALGETLPIRSWRCTMVWASEVGLPRSLDALGRALELDNRKIAEGERLIRYFCKPYTDRNGHQAFHTPADNPADWKAFKAYNKRDVEAEREIRHILEAFPLPKSEWVLYHLDQIINARGIAIDLPFVEKAVECNEKYRCTIMQKAKAITGLENPSSVDQMKAWLAKHDIAAPELTKDTVPKILESTADAKVREALLLYQDLNRKSTGKYAAMLKTVNSDGKARGLFTFYGAARTGRWSSKIIQLQNLAKNSLPDLDAARALVKAGDYETAEMLYGSIPGLLSELVRTALVPGQDKSFFVADFSSIEARLLATWAGETWREAAFQNGEDIYCSSSSRMFSVPVAKNGPNSHLRAKGKIAELALQYGGSVGALKKMGALRLGLRPEELQPLVDAWRQANANIVRLWWRVGKAAVKCVQYGRDVYADEMRFQVVDNIFFIHLPSGRWLAYLNPQLEYNEYGHLNLTYEGRDSEGRWRRISTYGPKLVQQITQSLARDLLGQAMIRLHKAGYCIQGHVHDEVIIEAPADASLSEICRIMEEPPAWAKNLLLKVEGYQCDFYQKQ